MFAAVPSEPSQDIRNRTFAFACRVAKLSLSMAARPGVRCLVDQLFKAGTSVGANMEEAKAASSRKEFIRYVEIALREAREAVYWLRIYEALTMASGAELAALRSEGEQIARILAVIVLKSKAHGTSG